MNKRINIFASVLVGILSNGLACSGYAGDDSFKADSYYMTAIKLDGQKWVRSQPLLKVNCPQIFASTPGTRELRITGWTSKGGMRYNFFPQPQRVLHTKGPTIGPLHIAEEITVKFPDMKDLGYVEITGKPENGTLKIEISDAKESPTTQCRPPTFKPNANSN